MDSVDQLIKVIDGGEVERFHTRATLTRQTNIHHGARVALISKYLDPYITSSAFLYAICHDVPELATGDIPGPSKLEYPHLKRVSDKIHDEVMDSLGFINPTEYEKDLIKVADLLETMWYCCEERDLGNRTLSDVFNNCLKQIQAKTLFQESERARKLCVRLGIRFGKGRSDYE